jgi:hypothetical protein
MLLETQVRELVELRAEHKNLDYKQSFDWNTAKDAKIGLIKDILAMLNTQDGGKIVVGVKDTDFELLGMPHAEFESFDTTKINDLLRRYTDPPASCELQKFVLDGKNVVVLDVPEFTDIAIICKTDANSSTDPAKLILRKGTIYIRTDKATSEAISNAEEMRELMTRSLLRRGDQLLQTIERLIKGGSDRTRGQAEQAYESEIQAAAQYLVESLPEMGGVGHWEIVAKPLVFKHERIPDLQSVARLIVESEVALRGWDFPRTERENAANFADGRQSFTNWTGTAGRRLEGYRACKSGLLFWEGAFREGDAQSADGHKMLSFINLIYQITEFFLFFKRYYTRFAEDSTIQVTIRLVGIKDRQLVSMDPAVDLFGEYVCQERELSIVGEHSVAELRASTEEIARKVVRRVFEIFNWSDPAETMIENWQRKLINR